MNWISNVVRPKIRSFLRRETPENLWIKCPETGQLVNGSMMDYFAPTASDASPIELLHTSVPSPVTPFGIRGVGEVGTIPPGAAIANAVCDALAEWDVDLTCLPITPESVWRALEAARATSPNNSDL